MGNKTKKQGQMLDCHADARNDEPSSNFAVGKMAGRDDSPDTTGEKTHHILSLSGGKDSTALAFFMKENNPEIFEQMELVFCDTECEIPETYDYLNKIEVFLNKKITRLKPEKSFDHITKTRKIIPSINNRWCTVELKTKPFNDFLKKRFADNNSKVFLYIGIRYDEIGRSQNRENYKISFIEEKFPFVEHLQARDDIENILISTGIGYPDYYKWRKRSGCYFCFYQSKMDWIKLYENQPDFYQKAIEYEYIKTDYGMKKRFGWNIDLSLSDMIKPENIEKIKSDELKKIKKCKVQIPKSLLISWI
ncbi:MAG: phosphoadenosine phosphosulfate reductase family protein [Candidatus Gastranaerophilales bacterium]